jgi:hypothetical protein
MFRFRGAYHCNRSTGLHLTGRLDARKFLFHFGCRNFYLNSIRRHLKKIFRFRRSYGHLNCGVLLETYVNRG